MTAAEVCAPTVARQPVGTLREGQPFVFVGESASGMKTVIHGTVRGPGPQGGTMIEFPDSGPRPKPRRTESAADYQRRLAARARRRRVEWSSAVVVLPLEAPWPR